MTETVMTFFDWMRLQVRRDDPVGDLAADMVLDAERNGLTIQDQNEWRERVGSQARANRLTIIHAFDKAASEYSRERRKWGKGQKEREPYNHDFW